MSPTWDTNQTSGKRSGGAIRGHILLDDVPYNR